MNVGRTARNSLGSIAALVLAACGAAAPGGGGASGSCNTFTPQCSCNNITSSNGLAGTCDEYSGVGYCLADGGTGADLCVSQGQACPTANLVGTCWPPQFDTVDTATLYYSPTYTAATAKAACEQGTTCFIAN